jgi:UDP-GlcNAc3NAcA epimerase
LKSKILTIVGARPQFVKAAVVSREILRHWSDSWEEYIVHTGQHYDESMSQVFFDQLCIPAPYKNLNIGGGSHGSSTGRMIEALEQEMLAVGPQVVLLYGDTNSTLAGAIAASKVGIPIAHVEAGLRSYSRKMPEEINRVLTDHVSRWLFCPTTQAKVNLANEGITDGVYHVGDVMFDVAQLFTEEVDLMGATRTSLDLPSRFALVTLHRAENADHRDRLESICEGLRRVSEEIDLIWPVHPRTRNALKQFEINISSPKIRLIDPVSLFDMIRLEKGCELVFTDSGGVQKEAYFHQKPCITLRDETEWVETVEHGWNQVVGCDSLKIVHAFQNANAGTPIGEYGDGKASGKIISRIDSDMRASQN